MNQLIEFSKWSLKWLGKILGGLLALVLLLVGGAWFWNWWQHDRHVSSLRVVVTNGEASGATSKLAADGKPVASLCKGEYPIFVGYTNESTRTVEDISIRVFARLPDHSTNILEWDAKASMDRIVPPKGGFGGCWKFSLKNEYDKNPKTAQAIYEGEVWSVTFRD